MVVGFGVVAMSGITGHPLGLMKDLHAAQWMQEFCAGEIAETSRFAPGKNPCARASVDQAVAPAGRVVHRKNDQMQDASADQGLIPAAQAGSEPVRRKVHQDPGGADPVQALPGWSQVFDAGLPCLQSKSGPSGPSAALCEGLRRCIDGQYFISGGSEGPGVSSLPGSEIKGRPRRAVVSELQDTGIGPLAEDIRPGQGTSVLQLLTTHESTFFRVWRPRRASATMEAAALAVIIRRNQEAPMALHPLAGSPVPPELIINVPRLVAAYYTRKPDSANPEQRVAFGTSGHRGCSLKCSFNEDHILATAQAICEHRRRAGIDGPLFLGMDTHALSEAAFVTALEVFAANDVEVRYQEGFGYTPTPVISHAILCWNRGRDKGLADGVVITPSHNPPADGGFKYNPPSGGPAGTEITAAVEARANEIIAEGLKAVRRIPVARALTLAGVAAHDYVRPYVDDLKNVVDLEAIRAAGLKIGVDPMGGSGVDFWAPIAETYGLDLENVNPRVDPTFSFMTVDKDGKIRMDCSSPWAMAGLIRLKDRFHIAFGNDPDYDRHGIVARSTGLLNPNHYLAVAIDYLFRHRPGWRADAAVGKTLVSSSMIDRVARDLGRPLKEVPVGFKWFVDGLVDGSYGFGGEESAGASFLRRDGTVWTTDKDGIILDLLAAEITAVSGRDPGEYYKALEEKHGSPVYKRIDAPASSAQKAAFKILTPEMVAASQLAGEPILARLTKAPGNNASIGGLKVVTENGWFAARPSGTEDIYKIYMESFRGEKHLAAIEAEAQEIVTAAFRAAGA